jgi:hypothetical protein
MPSLTNIIDKLYDGWLAAFAATNFSCLQSAPASLLYRRAAMRMREQRALRNRFESRKSPDSGATCAPSAQRSLLRSAVLSQDQPCRNLQYRDVGDFLQRIGQLGYESRRCTNPRVRQLTCCEHFRRAVPCRARALSPSDVLCAHLCFLDSAMRRLVAARQESEPRTCR